MKYLAAEEKARTCMYVLFLELFTGKSVIKRKGNAA